MELQGPTSDGQFWLSYLIYDPKVEALLSGVSTSFTNKREQVVYEMATCLRPDASPLRDGNGRSPNTGRGRQRSPAIPPADPRRSPRRIRQ